MNSIAVKTQGLTCDFKTVRAVDNLSLEIPSGIVFGFLGPNGAGKTTTIRMLLGLIEPTHGHASVMGHDVRNEGNEIRTRVGALLEHPGLYERMPAEDNLQFYGRVWRLSSKEREERIEELLTHLGLWERRKEIVNGWSRGMKQKLALARVLLHRPSMIFLDEPTAGLDPVAAAAIRDDLAALVENEGTTVFLTTHNLTEAEKLCHQVAMIRKGKLLDVGPPDEIRGKMGSRKASVAGRGFNEAVLESLRSRDDVTNAEIQDDNLMIELQGEGGMAPIVKMLVENGMEIEEVHKGSASLEEAFLTLMEEEETEE